MKTPFKLKGMDFGNSPLNQSNVHTDVTGDGGGSTRLNP